MKDKLLAVLFACAALLLFWLLLFPRPVQQGGEIVRPLSFETHADGYAALANWLEAEGFQVRRLRRRFDALAELAPAPRGNLLITTLPEADVVLATETAQLEGWVRAGNTLLVVAALDDTPRWGAAAAGRLEERLQRLARVDVKPEARATIASLAEALKTTSPELRPTPWHASATGVTAIATSSPLPATHWRVEAIDSAPLLVLARRADTDRPAVWLRPLGEGAIIFSAWASPFANGQIGSLDNARWVSQLVGWSLAHSTEARGSVIFDDMHQGATDYYDPRKFFADPRLHHTLWWLVALWFAYVLGARPLLAARSSRARIDDTAMLRVTGGFLAHVLRPPDAARRLFALFFNDLRRRLALPENGAPLWDWLAQQARVDATQLERLRHWHQRAERGRKVDLVKLQNSLLEITGRLS